MIGSLLYLTASRPDIFPSVLEYMLDFRQILKNLISLQSSIIRYVNDTLLHGIWYSRETNLVVAGHFDVEWAGNADDRKSTSGGCFYVGNNLVAWMSKKQSSISLSTAEVEYIATGSCCIQLLWMKKQLCDYGFTQDTMVIHCDNTSAINIFKNSVQHSRTKHIDIKHHFISDLVES